MPYRKRSLLLFSTDDNESWITNPLEENEPCKKKIKIDDNAEYLFNVHNDYKINCNQIYPIVSESDVIQQLNLPKKEHQFLCKTIVEYACTIYMPCIDCNANLSLVDAYKDFKIVNGSNSCVINNEVIWIYFYHCIGNQPGPQNEFYWHETELTIMCNHCKMQHICNICKMQYIPSWYDNNESCLKCEACNIQFGISCCSGGGSEFCIQCIQQDFYDKINHIEK